MFVYTVTKPVGTKDREFAAYTRLLEDVGIDVSDSPRVPEPSADKRWLYAWKTKAHAERFAAELRRRTGDAGWLVRQLDMPAEERGPVAPLEIAAVPVQNGYTYYLTPASRERVVAAFPGTRLPLGLTVPLDVEQDHLEERGPVWWMEVSRRLTGRSDEEIEALGGIRVVVGEDTVAFQKLPVAAAG